MKNLKISLKLLISYAIILLLLIISIAISVVNLVNIGNQVETFYNGPFTVSTAANVINERFEAMQKSTYRALSNADLSITNAAVQDAKSAASVIQQQLPIVRENFLGDHAIVDRLESYLTELTPMREHVLELALNSQNAEAAAYMEEHNIPTIKKAQAELDTLIQTAQTTGENLIKSIRSTQATSTLILIVLCIICVAISAIFAVYITRGITKPVAEIEQAARALSEGHLNATITYQSQDELGSLSNSMRSTISSLSNMIGDLSRLLSEIAGGNFTAKTKSDDIYPADFKPLLLSLRSMNRSLSDTLGQINLSADQVASGSDQVSNGSQALAQGAAEQASSTEELAATINDISGQVQNNAANAQEASKKAAETGEQIVASNQQMQDMIRAMDEISSSSSEIGKIIATIENIAFQTNILALNAAVEAARAGAAGKGFAVVADEVRSLANKSQEASKDTAALIERSIQAVKNGTQIADATAQSLLTAVEGAKMVVETVDRISSASEEQASSIAQVTQGVDQISSVVQTNSATAEESAAASEELSGQAQMLKDLVSRFRLLDSSGSGAQPSYEPSDPPARTPTPSFTGGSKY